MRSCDLCFHRGWGKRGYAKESLNTVRFNIINLVKRELGQMQFDLILDPVFVEKTEP